MSLCIISAYFKIPSKAEHNVYLPYLVNFFREVRSVPVIFFTTPDVISEIQQYTDTRHAIIIYLEFDKLQAFEKYGVEFWKRQKSRDPEEYHTYQLGAVWYEKKEFVLRATRIYKADIYVWCDAGCIRDTKSCKYARLFGTRNISMLMDNKIHLQQIEKNIYKDFYRYSDTFIAAAIMAGNKTMWESFSALYDQVLTDYDSHEVSAIMDQYIIKSCVDKRPDIFALHPEESSIDRWFKFLQQL